MQLGEALSQTLLYAKKVSTVAIVYISVSMAAKGDIKTEANRPNMVLSSKPRPGLPNSEPFQKFDSSKDVGSKSDHLVLTMLF